MKMNKESDFLVFATADGSIRKNSGQSNPNRLGSGIEINYENFIVQYSILTHHVLPVTHQFSFGYSLNK